MKKLNIEDWQQLIADYRSSGLTAPAWCEEKQLSIHKLHYWITKFNKAKVESEQGQQWISVKSDLPVRSSSITIKIGPAEISVSQDYDKQLFVDVVQSLISLC